jgi:hypothetical protein
MLVNMVFIGTTPKTPTIKKSTMKGSITVTSTLSKVIKEMLSNMGFIGAMPKTPTIKTSAVETIALSVGRVVKYQIWAL